MAATLHSGDDELPVILTLDTSWIVAVFNAADTSHGRAWALYQRLLAADTGVVVCRPLLELEFCSALRKLAHALTPREIDRMVEQAEARLGSQRTLRLRTMDRRNKVEVRRHLIQVGTRLLSNALDTFEVAEVRLTRSLITTSRDWMIRHDLDSHDALHTEIAHRVGRSLDVDPHIVTLDGDFRVVDGLHVWGLDDRRIERPV